MLKRLVVVIAVVAALILLLSTVTTLSAWVAATPTDPGSPAPIKVPRPASPVGTRADETTAESQAVNMLASLPLRFVPNAAQDDPEVRFAVRSAGHVLLFTPDQVFFQANSTSDAEGAEEGGRVGGAWAAAYVSGGFALSDGSGVVKLRFSGANPGPMLEGMAPLAGVVNYFLGGDPGQWRANVPTYGALAYRGLYPGIDLIYLGTEGHLKSEFVVAPGADPGVIEMVYSGVGEAWLREDGALVLETALGQIVEEAPLIYQEVDGERVPVAGGYVLYPASTRERGHAFHVRFRVGSYDPRGVLIIDPVLCYSTYLGGSDSDVAKGVAADAQGNTFIAGETRSGNFPRWEALDGSRDGTYDVFVTKIISANGTYTYGYSTYLGGSGDEYQGVVAVDAAGDAFVGGYTNSSDFPTTTNAIDGDLGGSTDAFVTKIISTSGGYTLGLSTYLGGSHSSEQALAIAVDAGGNVYLAGNVYNGVTYGWLPQVHALQTCDWSEAFVAKIISTTTGYTLELCSCLGGHLPVYDHEDYARAIAVDASGDIYVTGATQATDYPTTANALQPARSGSYDAFVTKIITAGGTYTWAYSSYLGGSANDYGYSIAADDDGGMYVTGVSYSGQFPTTTNSIQPVRRGDDDAFVTVIVSPSGAYTYAYSSYLGGDGAEEGHGIVARRDGIYVAGSTTSSNFPTTTNALQQQRTSAIAYYDMFLTRIVTRAGAYTYTFSTYWGGTANDGAFALAMDPQGRAHVAGYTNSGPSYSAPRWPLVRAVDTVMESTHDGYEGAVFVVDMTPQVTDHRPSQHAVGVAVTAPITLTFDSTMDASTVNSHTLFVHGHLTGLFTDSYSYDGASETLTFTPTRSYHTGEVVRVHATAGISDIGGAALRPYGWEFTAGPVVSRCFGCFTDIGATASLTDVYHSAVAWGDYDNDGDLDIVLSGDASSGPVSRVYRNDGGGAFTDIGAGLTGVSDGSVAWGDYDNDGDLDILLSGDASSGPVSRVYRNDGGGAFTDIGAGLTGVSDGAVAWGDYDNDGDLDILLTGDTGSGAVSIVYRNDGGGVFSGISAGLVGVTRGAVDWGDYDNDGDLDVLLSGWRGAGASSTVYRNDGGGTFTNIDPHLAAVASSAVAWGDYDNDGDLDILLTGFGGSGNVSMVYRNDGGAFTDIGAGLTGVSEGAVAWGDYDNDGDLDILLTGRSASGAGMSIVYRNDGGGTFTDIGAGLFGVHYSDAAWGDYDNDGDLDILLAGLEPPRRRSLVYRNDGGGVFTDIGAGLTAVNAASVAWGDVDNDGDLDILLTGHTGSSPLSTVYRNDDCPDLSIIKQAEPATVDPGGDITYTLSFSNASSSVATGVRITDIVPITVTQLAYQSSLTITPTGSVSFAWQVQDLAPGQQGFITITGVISRFCSPTRSMISNAATITPTRVDAHPLDNVDDATMWVNATTAPTVSFVASPLSCCAPLTVYFTDTSTAGSAEITAWHWTFGDGGTAAISRTSHVYNSSGIYTVTLTVTDSNGCSATLARSDYITAHSVAASFDLSPYSGCAPLTVYVTDTSTASPGSVAAWHWDYGDGVGSSTTQNPAPYVYGSPGTFTVTLTVTDSHGCSSSAQRAVTASACLEIDKYDLVDPVAASWRIRYRIRVRNTSTVAFATVLVTDTLPAGTYFLPLLAENAGWFDGGGFVTRPIHSLLGGAEVTLELVLGTHSTASGVVTNRAEARWTDVTVTDEETTTIQPRPAPTPTPTPTPAPGPGTVAEIRSGLDDDNPDTYIYRYAPNANYALQPLLRVGYKQTHAALLRFDLSAIPPGATIDEAWLEVYAAGWSGPGADITIGAYAIKASAQISETTWNEAQAGGLWAVPGCGDTILDRRDTPESTLTTAGPLRWYRFDLSALVQGWFGGATTNNGVLLRQEAYNLFSCLFASAEYPNSALRPRLVVRYH